MTKIQFVDLRNYGEKNCQGDYHGSLLGMYNKKVNDMLKRNNKDKKYIVVFFLLASFFSAIFSPAERACCESYTFDHGMEGWSSWGGGGSGRSATISYKGTGAVYLDCDDGEDRVLYKEMSLPNGTYKVSAWIRGLSIQQSDYKEGVWLYYKAEDENEGVVNVVSKKDVYGSFDWSKTEYIVDVKNKKLQIWFSLRTSGRMWLDDISITPYSGEKKTFVFNRVDTFDPVPNKSGDGVRCGFCGRWWNPETLFCPRCGEKIMVSQSKEKGLLQQKYLLDFENKDKKKEASIFSPQKYDKIHTTSGMQSGVIRDGQYNNVDLKTVEQKNWNGYDYIGIDIYNPTNDIFKFSLAISDYKTKGYWDQLNHYSTLAPGWNTMKFPLRQYVGERGSVRTKRYLDFSKIKRFWFRVDSAKDKTIKHDFFVDNVRLTQSPELPTPFTGLFLFDFVKEKFRTYPGFIPVGTRDTYDKDTGFGFSETHFWRSHDSLYADQLYRDGIFVKEGHFQVDVPNGEYIVRLVPNGLGEWFEHFWTQRKIKINGKVVLSEQRRTAQDYLDNLLRFQDIEPRFDDNPYDLYLTKIFSEIRAEVQVRNGNIDISFSGDDSSIMLNTLIIYPLSKKMEGDRFMAELFRVQKDEFENLCRFTEHEKKLGKAEDNKKRKDINVLLLDRLALPWHAEKTNIDGSGIKLKAARLQSPAQTFIVNTFERGGNLTITTSNLKTASGDVIQLSGDSIRYGVRQYFSHSINHETYDLVPRYFKPVPERMYLIPNDSVLFYYQISVPQNAVAGTYFGSIEITFDKEKKTYPVKLEVIDAALPEVDIPVGFFGLAPVSFAYFKGIGVGKLGSQFMEKSLKLLRKKGFTTWTSLPPIKYSKDANSTWEIDTRGVDNLMKTARELGFRHKIFTYGSTDNWILQPPPDKRDENVYWMEKSRLLRTQMKKKNWLPIVVDISDEAAGYSQKVERDLKRAELMMVYFPYFQRGGYTHPIKKGEYGDKLNMQLNAMSLSSTTDEYLERLRKRDLQWGRYIQATGMTDTNRVKFGLDLFLEQKKGAQHLLGWSLCLSQNYPYYDLDGREKDAMMFYPRKDGTLLTSLNFEQAVEGLEDYRLLCLLEQLTPYSDRGKFVKWLKNRYTVFSDQPAKMREEIFVRLALAAGRE